MAAILGALGRRAALSAVRTPATQQLPLFANSLAGRRFFSSEEIKLGQVKWFDSTKGFGFIVPEDGSADVFVHQTVIHKDGFRSLAENEAVEYKLTTGQNGKLQAADVTGPGGAYVQGAPPQPRRDYDDYDERHDGY
jgi:cold shock CspA family protein